MHTTYSPSLKHEDLISLSEAAAFYEHRSGHRPSSSTVFRHARRGVKARTGERIRLEHLRIGGRIFTSREAIERFWNELAEADAVHFAATN